MPITKEINPWNCRRCFEYLKTWSQYLFFGVLFTYIEEVTVEMYSNVYTQRQTMKLFTKNILFWIKWNNIFMLSCQWHQMETCSMLLALCERNPLVTGGFPSQRPVTWSFDIFFDLRLNKWLSNQPRHRWIEMPLCSLWHHCDWDIFCEYNPWCLHCFNSLAPGRFQFDFR